MKTAYDRRLAALLSISLSLAFGSTCLAQMGAWRMAYRKTYSLEIAGDVTPEFAPTVGRLTVLFYECYPKLVERFEHPKKPAPRKIKLVFAHALPYPAYCTGSEIHVNIDWLTKHPDDIALLTHELTHSVQAYPRGDPGWFVEGLADYARQKYGPKVQPGWSLPKKLTAKQSYRDGYRVSAAFLIWLDAKHPGSVDKIHRRMQDREYEPNDFKAATGKTLDELWAECVKEMGAAK